MRLAIDGALFTGAGDGAGVGAGDGAGWGIGAGDGVGVGDSGSLVMPPHAERNKEPIRATLSTNNFIQRVSRDPEYSQGPTLQISCRQVVEVKGSHAVYVSQPHTG